MSTSKKLLMASAGVAVVGGNTSPFIRDSGSTHSNSSGSQTLSITAPSVVSGDYVVIVIAVNNSSAITAFGDLTGWTQDVYETSTPERLLVLSTTVVGNETWINSNIECTIAAQYSCCVFSVANVTGKQVGTFNDSTSSSVILSSLSLTNPSLLLSLSGSDNSGTVTSITNSSYTFTSVVESSTNSSLQGEVAIYSAGLVYSGATGTVTITIDTSYGLAAVLLAFS